MTTTVTSLSKQMQTNSIDNTLWEFQQKVIDILYQAKLRGEMNGDAINKELEEERQKAQNKLLGKLEIENGIISFLRQTEDQRKKKE